MSEPTSGHQTPAGEHKHLFRMAVGDNLTIRYCGHCGRAWLLSELQESFQPHNTLPAWTEILEENEVPKKFQKQRGPGKTAFEERSWFDRALGIRPAQQQR